MRQQPCFEVSMRCGSALYASPVHHPIGVNIKGHDLHPPVQSGRLRPTVNGLILLNFLILTLTKLKVAGNIP